ncbi:MAG TPA: NUDIX domain-containing protein [Patescibacteria group bacterium]|nr:NUDIX domain-containing protein [Patescibacteria group bacterium]
MINQKPFVHNLVLVSNVLIRKDGKFLLMKRSAKKKYAPGRIHPFGGKLDPDENPYVGAVREIKEEVGIKIKNLKLEAIVLELQHEEELPVNWLVFYFRADYESGEIISSEEGEAVFLTEYEIKSADLFPSFKSIINNILTPTDGTVFTTNGYEGFETGLHELAKNICVVK